MSAEIELADTLCTTEDAFESFQAKVSHEEEEYVTLSDLVSPSDKTHAKVDEVTVESIGDENGPCESNLEKIIETAKDYSNEVIDNHFKHSLSNESTEHNILIETNSDITDSFNNSIDKNKSRAGNKIQTSAQTETVPQKRKRGRPKKCIETSVKDVSLDSTPLKTRTGRRNITETKTNSTINFNSIENVDNVQIVSSTINDSVLNDTKRKRRRPIKYANELVEPESISSIPVERDESSINTSKGKLKGVMKKKAKGNNIKSKKNDSEAIIKTLESTVDSRDNIVDDGIKMNLTECKLQNDAIDSSSLLVEMKKDNYLDETDDICLSRLKSICEINPINDTNMIEREINDKEHDLTPREQETEIKKRTPKKAIMNDIECSTVNNDISKPAMDIDNIKVQVDTRQNETQNLELEALDPTKRPVRRRAKQVFKYDEESDEDPFANVELSDDEPHRRKKGKYNSDDEYVPGKKYVSSGSSLDSDMERNEYDDDKKQKKWRFKKLDKSNKNKSPKKRINKSGSSHGRSNNSKTESEILDVDVEDSLESSVLIKETSNSWETSSNITDYLAKKIQGTDIKIMKAKPSEGPITKFEIPVLNQNEPKKTKESDTQTKSIVNISKTTQTDSHQALPMKKQVSLSLDQTERACEFLRNIVETTAELGELMTQKSRDFIEKKINTTNVTDTFKMDYCVKKSFLLFKLAKHNLMQMEQDLETKYEEFLQSNNLLQYREQQKVITPQQEAKEDSDCEIVEEITPVKPHTKSKFNPKTVFLNKELSIKIAKTAKPSPKSTENHNIKGRHTVWINESVMVKKVQPTQSFLAQDSRNKKPPDFITLEMVKNFFDNYYRQKEVLSICRRYTSLEWISINKSYVCNYFVKDASDLENDISDEIFTLTASNVGTTSSDFAVKIKASPSNISPKRLLTLCTESIQKHLNILKKDVKSKIVYNEEENTLVNQHIDVCHKTLYVQNDTNDNIDLIRTITPKRCIKSLKTICILKINIFLNKEHLETQSVTSITKTSHKSEHKDNKDQVFQVPSLSLSCFKIIQGCFSPLLEEIPLYSVNSLSSLAIKTINAQMTQKSFCDCEYFLPLVKEIPLYSVNSLSSLALKTMNAQMIKKSLNDSKNYETKNNLQSDTGDTLALKINYISSITEEDFSTLQVPQIDSAQSIHSYNEDDDDSINNEEDTYFNNDDNLLFANEDDTYREDFNSDGDLIQQLGTEDSNWVSLVQMQELRSCVPSIVNSNQDFSETDNQIVSSEQSTISKIKIEPEEPESDINVMNIKAEPQEEEEMPLPTAHVMTKEEHIEEITRVIDEPRPKLSRQNSKSYSEDLFESFVSSNKIIKDISTTYMMNNDEIYSQSSQRIRRQYEPDSDGEITTFNDDMGLLVPQSIEVVKDQLMENSSDESSNRKQVKKKSAKPLKLKKNPKELVKDRPPVVGNDITVRTRKMKEKIRQLERKNDSSDSETEEIPLQARRVKHQVCEKSKVTEEKVQEKTKIPVQCSEVDSTEHISSEIVNQSSSVNTRNPKKLRICTTQGISRNQSNEQLCPDVNLNVPSELLECEPDIAVEDEPIKNITYKDTIDKSTENDVVKICDKNSEAEYIDRYGWKCYCINPSDPKIYENSTVVLEKLPESFVDTYLRFQDMEDDSDDDNDDAEVNRLINLASLTRPSAKDRTRVKNHDRNLSNKLPKLGEDNASSSENMNDDEHCAELTPSEDEDDGHDYNDIPQSAPRNAENCMAKNILMDDNESDSEQTNKFDENINIKQEPGTNVAPTVKVTPGPKSKAKDAKPINEDPVMLTANIMMNSELTLLHTPVVMKEETTPDIEDLQKPIKMATRGAKKQKLNKHKTDLSRKDESSSEEEKQWVYTKEKLLKRIEKKHETAIVDEVKGAKRVSEFIEKRGEASEHQTSKSRTNRGRGRSKKKMLERRKQMNVLAKELFGEQLSSRKCSQNYGKGRRNIRKVLNKQSLNHATVIANKEEFERKRRLNNRQAQLAAARSCSGSAGSEPRSSESCSRTACSAPRAATRSSAASRTPPATPSATPHPSSSQLPDRTRTRYTRKILCMSCAGFHEVSRMMTRFAAVMLRPRQPARVDTRNNLCHTLIQQLEHNVELIGTLECVQHVPPLECGSKKSLFFTDPLVKTTKKEKSTLEDKPTTSSDFASTSTTGSKVKKGKNNQTSKEKLCSAAEGVTPDVLSPDKEEMLVKKIMQILIENNFHETIQAEELTNLIVNVRRLVSSHMGDHGLLKDPIAAGIASVLLQDDAIMGNNVPDEQIIQDHVPSRDEEPKLSQRRKRTKNMIFDVENDSDDDIEDARNAYDDDDVEWTCDIDTKTLRPYEKRSKTKKTHLDKKVENIKDNQDTDENVKCAQVGNVKKVKDVEIVKHTQVEHVKATQDKNVAVVPSNNVTQSGSILISDDDDDDEEPVRESTSVTPIVPPKPKMKERLKEKQNVPNKRKEEKKEEERVPLHPMILTNENFIKIVAHMYQRGNSMLSDDAAKMAAQYSTNKARSEYEATGVPIISGPLYEIAIESLGLEQLRRMHETLKIQPVKQPVKTPQQPSTTETTTVDFYSTEPTNDDDVLVVDTVVEKKNCVGPKSRRKRFIEPSPSPPPVVETNQMITPEPQPQNVFPVGIFKGPAQAAKSHPAQVIEECILPDDDEDDDVIISSVVQRPVRVLTPLSVNNETRATRSSINRSFIDKHIPIGCQTLTTEPIQPTQVTPTQAKPPQIQITQIHTVQTKPPHIQSTPNPAKQTKPPQNQITPIHATRTKTPHLQITPVYPAQSKPPGMRLLEIDKTTPVVPESTTPAQIITSQELDSNEPICLSDSDDEIVEPRPVGSNNPTSEPPNAIQTASKNTATPVAPFVVQTASFKGSTPFILSEKARRVLDPNKKYYCIPASTFINKGIGNSGLDSSIQLDVQNRDNNISKPSIVITSVGQIQVDGASQYQTNNEVSPHVIISPSHLSTPPQHRGSNDQYANNDPSMKSGKIELITTKIYSASDCNNLSAETATNKSVPNAQSKVLSLPITSNAYIKNSGKPNVVSQASHKNRSPSPPASADHTQLFKDVVQIQADTYREIPKVVITKTKPTVVKLPLKNDLHHTHKQTSKSIAHTSRDRPVVTAKPSSTVFLKGSTNENGNNKLMILKKVEKMKDDNMNKSSSSSKVIKVDKAATKKMAVSSFIDLTDVPEKKQKVEKRPAPYIEKPVKKQKKLLTLADFTLDDIDDITELE
ncbi:uncharacterized protein LOC119831936 [Zerene cesonia]|uniref:uncharacterized protein LOC119831936 n=1 Tax=Zerene cesonia TaxID=33412 RepID=UPI0018E57C97|nr:uncharacterized protein LOC119831936 [Zerene cesonia]